MSNDLLPIHKKVLYTSDAWAARFVEQRRAAIERRGLVASGALESQLGYGMKDDAADLRCTLLVSFPGYGRIAEMKNVEHDKWGRNAIGRVEAWIRAKGMEKFLPGFMEKYQFKTPPKDAVLRMAWGVLVSRASGKFQRKKWYNAAKTAGLNELYNEVAIATAEETLQTVKNAFNFNQYARIRGRE